MLTDLRVLIVRMMQAPRDNRIDSPYRICLPPPTYLVLTVAVRARRRATGRDAAPTHHAYTSMPLLLCLYFAYTYYADACELPRTTTPILTSSYAPTYEVPHDWKTIKLMPSTSSVEWLRRVTANQGAHNAMAEPETPPPEHAADAPPAPSPSEDDCPPLA